MKIAVKKAISLLLCCASVFTLMCSCGSKQAEQKKTKISIGNWPNEEADKNKYDAVMKRKEQFEAENPDIEIVPDEWQYDVKTFLPKAEGGTLPTVYQTHFSEAKKIVKFKYSANVTDLLKEYDYYNKINDKLLDNISENGEIYLLPLSAYTLGVLINMNLFREAGLVDENDTPYIPDTFEKLAEYAEIVHKKTGKAGFVFPTAENGGGWNFTMLAWNFGTTFMEQKGGKWQSTFNSKECADALEYLKDLKWNKNAMPASTKINNSEVIKLFGTDQVAMAIAHPGQLDALIKNYGMDLNSIGYIKMPAGPKRHVTLMGGAYYGFSPNASKKELEAAFKWIRFNGFDTEIDDSKKERVYNSYKEKNKLGNTIIGISDINLWNTEAESRKYTEQIVEEFRNIPINHVASYNDKSDIDYQVEEPVCAQDLYSILDSCIQEVLTNKDAVVSDVLEKAASDFQNNFLDYEN